MKKNKLLNSSSLWCAIVLAMAMTSCGIEPESTNSTEEPMMAEAEATNEQEWDYENTDWENISGSECRSNVQSPIDIDTQAAIEANLAEIKYNYTPFNMKIVDNGHTIQVYGTENSSITVEGKEHQFVQFHFHAPAEHTINGKRYPLEMHLVHKENNSDNLAVLGIFIEEGAKENEFLEKIFANIPTEKEKEVMTDVSLTLSDYIPPAQEHYTYTGSLTTPPCTVGVDWIVFTAPIQASKEQIDKFTSYYSDNARPVQEINNRKVLKTMD